MMNKSPDRLYELLPAIYRIRDAELGYPLRDLLRVITEQVDVVEADITQLYDNWFIETCQDWVVPYIGDLIDYQSVPHTGKLGNASTLEGQQHNKILIPRREVANTIRYRRRKGTLALIESLAYKIAGWSARVVEFYKFLSYTQNINHLGSLSQTTVNLCQMDALGKLDSPFDELAHIVDIRRIISQYETGKYNIPSVGVFVCRLKTYSVTRTPAYCLEEVSPNCYTFSITGNDIPLYTHPVLEEDSSQNPREWNLPIPISRRALQSRMSDYYGPISEQFLKSLEIWVGDGSQVLPVLPEKIIVADLSDWNYQPPRDHVAVDPELGRMVFPRRQLPKNGVWVSYYYGFSADIGGGEYNRPLLNPEGNLLLDVEDAIAPAGPIAKLKENSPLSQFMRSQFSLNTQNLLNSHNPVYSPQLSLIKAVVDELNLLLLSKSLYEEHRFASIRLTERTNWLVQHNLQGKELIRLNRLLLQEAFPYEIRKHKDYTLYQVSQNIRECYQTITEAILQWQREKPRHAVIEILDSGVYVERIDIHLETHQTLQLRAANRQRPVIRILDWRTSYGDALNVTLNSGSSFTLDGLLITGRGVHIEGVGAQGIAPLQTSRHGMQKPPSVFIRHCTLVPGWSLHCDCEPRHSNEPSLELFNTDAHTVIEHSIVGSIEVNQDEVQTDPSPIHIYDSIIDATKVEREAIGAVGSSTAHARLTIARSTVLGQINVHSIDLAENSIFNGKIFVSRQQQGCIRFCYVTPNSRTPHRYNCQPDLVEQAIAEEAERQQERDRVQPQFNSTHYGTPTYCQLADSCAEEIKHGADDESEMGVFHHLYQYQKAANLRNRLDEYTPIGMQVGIIYIN
ncbi:MULTISPECIES: hypothetical protein [Nostocales]|uniref:Uncharacterized protein n=2 Tax=Nostocales TaxID=1161 RepID=A0A8S9T257_9CYAN|nr:hypothetical protein [Tolypothrix bouteillei]KAF3886721.1 hypothetical protein DA73_0400015460 [Tolypothrix bouteillei VB521301]